MKLRFVIMGQILTFIFPPLSEFHRVHLLAAKAAGLRKQDKKGEEKLRQEFAQDLAGNEGAGAGGGAGVWHASIGVLGRGRHLYYSRNTKVKRTLRVLASSPLIV